MVYEELFTIVSFSEIASELHLLLFNHGFFPAGTAPVCRAALSLLSQLHAKPGGVGGPTVWDCSQGSSPPPPPHFYFYFSWGLCHAKTSLWIKKEQYIWAIARYAASTEDKRGTEETYLGSLKPSKLCQRNISSLLSSSFLLLTSPTCTFIWPRCFQHFSASFQTLIFK